MALAIQQNVFWLNISVDETQTVKVVQGKDQFGRIKPCLFFSEANLFPEMIEKLSSVDVIKDEENPLRRLEGIMQGYQEWMVGSEQYLSLLYGVMQ